MSRMRRPCVPAALCSQPFTAEQAAAHGLTGDQLRSAPWRQVFHRVWVHADLPDSRSLRLQAARLIIPPYGVVCGLSAAWLHGVDVLRLDDLDLHVSFPRGRRTRSRPGLRVCQETLHPSDITDVDGMRVTTALRTAFDCLRWLRGAERLVVADALAHAGVLDVAELRRYFATKRRLRNLRIGEGLVDDIEPLSESPMETRTRALMLDAGIPPFTPQWSVYDATGAFVGRLDLADRKLMLAVEYDGALHWEQRRADDRRRDALRALGWTVIVVSADDIFRTPEATVARISAQRRRLMRARAG